MNKKIIQTLTLLKIMYAASPESERINNPERNDDKYFEYCHCIAEVYSFTEHVKGKLEVTDPELPIPCHQMEIVIPTDDPDLDITTVKGKLADTINSADEANICLDKLDNICIYLCWNDIYTPREV